MNRPDCNDRVTGTCHGVPFSGVVSFCRPHTMNTDLIYHVTLESPVTVYGDTRDALCITVDFDSLTSKYGDSIYAS